ncbi:uncharacterized protein LOC144641477 isoform X1 [Oculina patagonica]
MNIVASLLLSALTYAVSNGCDTVLTEAGACCVFPFEYNGENYCRCTSNNWFRPWCSLTPFYAGKWGHCPDDQATTAPPTSSGCNTVETKEGDCCHFPFEYKGETYCECTSDNWVRPWCSLTPIYEGLWGHCPDNQPTTTPPVGTTTAPPTTSDTTTTTTSPVGATTAPPTTSDTTTPPVGTTTAPATTSDTTTTATSPVGTTTAPPTTSDTTTTTTSPVGTTTAPPTTSDNQPTTTAPPVVTTAAPPPPTTSGCNTVETKEGDCCHFPFEYKGETYCKCTSDNWVRPWCSLTPIYEGMWGHCPDNQPTTTPPVGTTTAPPTTSDTTTTTTSPVGTTTAPPTTSDTTTPPVGTTTAPATTSDTTTTTTSPVGTTTAPPTTSDNQPTTAAPPVVTTAAPPPPTTSAASCGSRPVGARIVGGTQAQNGSWPWMAMLAYAGGSQFCGGSLIGEQWVLTAAQCVDGFSPSQIVVRMGAYKITDIAQELEVERIIMHESFDIVTYENDIALLKLKTEVTLGTSVGLVCLNKDNTLASGTCCITGWGWLEENAQSQPDYLQEASVELIGVSECNTEPYHPDAIFSTMLCAGLLPEGGVDACQGDVGGPLVCEGDGKWYLTGVTSWNEGCARPEKPGVYTKVLRFVDWIYAISGIE